jgi:hypothetical protein
MPDRPQIESASRRFVDVALYAITFLIAFTVRVGFYEPKVTPDGQLYLRIADNVAANHCYSESPPGDGLCNPSWGNQPPGYPFFIAVVKTVSAGTPQAVVVAQSLVYALSIVYVLISVRRGFRYPRGWMVAAALVLALSPLTVSWSHWILGETLGGAATLGVIAECINSLAGRRFRTGPLSLAVVAAVMMRWDLIWLLAPVCLVAWQLRGAPRFWVRPGVVVASASVAILLLMARAVLVGLPAVPSMLSGGPDELPPGIVGFWRVAATGQNATSGLLWKVWNQQYAAIGDTFDYDSISRRVDAAAVGSALRELSQVPNGRPVPKAIDDQFAMIAGDALHRSKGWYWPVVWFDRIVMIWSADDTIYASGWSPGYEPFLRAYRIVLMGLLLIAIGFFPAGSSERTLAVGVFLFVFTRTIFLVAVNALETRYLIPVIPVMELVATMFISRLWTDWSNLSRSTQGL